MTISDDAVTSTKLANGAVTASKVEGLTSGQIIVGVDGTAANNAKVNLTGDVTMSNAGVTTIADNSVDGTDIALGSDAAGDVMYYNGTDWIRLAKGTAGQVLTVNSGATAPEWKTPTSSSALSGSGSWVLGNLNGNTKVTTTVTVAGAAVGDVATANIQGLSAAMGATNYVILLTAEVTSANTVTVSLVISAYTALATKTVDVRVVE